MTLQELMKKLKALRYSIKDAVRWHMSPDVFYDAQLLEMITYMNEEHEKIYTIMGLPITVHPELQNHISIE